jgi:hypothetical protein
MFWSHEPVAPWQSDSWKAEMRRSLRPQQFQRMIENRFVSAESGFIDISLWDECVDPRIGHMVADRTLPVWAAVDASIKHDSTALAAVTWSQEYQHVRRIMHRSSSYQLPSRNYAPSFADGLSESPSIGPAAN